MFQSKQCSSDLHVKTILHHKKKRDFQKNWYEIFDVWNASKMYWNGNVFLLVFVTRCWLSLISLLRIIFLQSGLNWRSYFCRKLSSSRHWINHYIEWSSVQRMQNILIDYFLKSIDILMYRYFVHKPTILALSNCQQHSFHKKIS